MSARGPALTRITETHSKSRTTTCWDLLSVYWPILLTSILKLLINIMPTCVEKMPRSVAMDTHLIWIFGFFKRVIWLVLCFTTKSICCSRSTSPHTTHLNPNNTFGILFVTVVCVPRQDKSFLDNNVARSNIGMWASRFCLSVDAETCFVHNKRQIKKTNPADSLAAKKKV